jgi:hypothetical protein
VPSLIHQLILEVRALSGHVTVGAARTPDPEGGITNIVWTAGSPPFVQVTTAQAHGMANGTYRLQVFGPNPGGFAVPMQYALRC